MRLKTVVELLNADIYCEELYNTDCEISYGFSCDLMSDALMLLRNNFPSFEENGMLVTGLISKQAIRTAEMLDLTTILFVRGKKPTQELIELAKESGIQLIATKYAMYTANGILYKNGLSGIDGIQ